ncbi:hypothetical protein L1987_39121 [Smallanthus sonchifolius]|uniref:Uncharacterized protein n=1 Tax=Smallanthus sonchifolius TaxID=185202 RepID=A0ACB9HMH9_9ASTR|nr:hypothetical protein L1987_39121 [Smallanthus sonchifolius]
MPEFTPEPRLFRVGYALPPRKTQAFMVEPFITHAKHHNIHFIPIDISKPLINQGPFDCILHKFYGQEWDLNLQTFTIHHPNATVIDRPAAIQRLHNRISMLEPIPHLNIPNLNIPNQLLVHDTQTLISTTKDLVFPVIAKPLLADGTTNAHNMVLIFNHEGLTKGLELDPPLVLQQFVNHGGVIFKVYVAGGYVKCVKRSSLPDVLDEGDGVMSFSQVSSSVVVGGDDSDEKVKMPAAEFVGEVAKGLKEALGLHLFNFDLIKDDKSEGYFVVDVNYFPGYEKLPFYESVMTDFLLDVKKSQEVVVVKVDVEKT